MKKFKLYLKEIVIILLCLLFSVVIALCYIGGIFDPMPNYTIIEKSFHNNKEIITEVTNYLIASNYQEVYISDTEDKDTMFTGLEYGNVEIENANVIEAIQLLKRRGYSVIEKSKNAVHFQKWENKDNGRGVVYSINGNEPILQFSTKLQPLSESNWYYYEEDYNEYRIQNNK